MSKQRMPDNKEEEIHEGINSIAARGFKSITDECTVEVRPLTILAGANSSGKSSIMQPLLLLKQTLDAAYDPGPLLLDGPHVRFTSTDQFLCRRAGKNSSDLFVIKVEVDNSHSITVTFNKPFDKGLELIEMVFDSEEEKYTLRPEMSHAEIEDVIPSWVRSFRKFVSETDETDDAHLNALEWRIGRRRCFLGFDLVDTEDRNGGKTLPGFMPGGAVDQHLRMIIHVPALRGNPERTYKTTAVGERFAGTFENYVASVINHWQNTKDARLRELERAIKSLGLTWRVSAKQVDDVRVELHVGRMTHRGKKGVRDMVSIADAGFGVSQVLPVLVAVLEAQPGQLVYLEQPEIHLHPSAKAKLAQVFSEAAIRGVHTVVETHSSSVLLGVQSLVAEGKLPPHLVKIHWFERDKNGKTKITSADLDEKGAFGDWPGDFADVALGLEGRYLDAIESRR